MQLAASMIGANMLEVALPLLRTVVLARILAPDQLGLAVSLLLIAVVADAISEIGLWAFAVKRAHVSGQADPLATLHTLNFLRGSAIALLLFVAAPAYTSLFGIPHGAQSELLPASIFLIRGLEHFGHKRLMREYVFWREASLVASGQIAWTVTSIAVAFLQRDYSCLVWGYLAAMCTTVILSHIMSPQPWRLGWDRDVVAEAMRFGLPLVPNGMAAALNFADRLLIGAMLNPVALALYSVVISSVLVPKTALMKLTNSLLIPVFANLAGDPPARAKVYHIWLANLSVLAFGYGLVLVAVGGPLLGFVFGPAYQPSAYFMGLASINVFIKIMMHGPVPPGYGLGQTRLILAGSLSAAFAVVPGAVAVRYVPSVDIYFLVFTAAEFLALIWFMRKTMLVNDLRRRYVWPAILYPCLVLSGLTVLARSQGLASAGGDVRFWAVTAASVGGVAISVHIATLIALKMSLLQSNWRKI